MTERAILIVDDDRDLAEIISDMLESYGYRTEIAESGDEAYEKLAETSYSLVLLDINLPDTTGLEICRELRRVSAVPVIFASARGGEDDRIAGLDLGGDDYLPKPYSMKELLAHINALLRRTYASGSEEKIVSFGNVFVNITARAVTKNSVPVALSLREFDLLSKLAENKNAAMSKDKLLSEVWGAFSAVEPSTLAVHIRWLREKLEDNPAEPKYIKTVRGVGYILEDENED